MFTHDAAPLIICFGVSHCFAAILLTPPCHQWYSDSEAAKSSLWLMGCRIVCLYSVLYFVALSVLYNLYCIVLYCLYWRVFSSDCIVGFTTSFHSELASILSRSTTNAKIRQKVYFLAKNRKIVSSAKSRKIESFAEDLLILTLQLCLFVF